MESSFGKRGDVAGVDIDSGEFSILEILAFLSIIAILSRKNE